MGFSYVMSPLTFCAFNVLLVISLVPFTHGAQFRRGSSLLFGLRGLFQFFFFWFSGKFGERGNNKMPISFPQNKMQNLITYQKKKDTKPHYSHFELLPFFCWYFPSFNSIVLSRIFPFCNIFLLIQSYKSKKKDTEPHYFYIFSFCCKIFNCPISL